MSIQTADIATIPKETVKNTALSYDAMVKEGIQLIGDLAGKNWSNYNPSDPGITILEMLCYALLDLGYKSHFPIEDLLTNKEGTLSYGDCLYTARQILFSNPVTPGDFRKLLLDQAEGVKNVWVKPVIVHGAFHGTYQVDYEVTDDLKLAVLKMQGEKKSLKDLPELRDTLEDIDCGIRALLCRHRNLGELFLNPKILAPLESTFSGTFYLTKEADVEKVLAWIYCQLNNYASRYIQFHTYQEMKATGLEVGQILNGPRLDHGFILDQDLEPFRHVWDKDVLQAELIKREEVKSLYAFGVALSGSQSNLKVPFGKIPFFNYRSAGVCLQQGEFSIVHGDHAIHRVDQARVNAHYEAFTDRKAVSSFNFKNELGPEVPKGKYRKVKEYHSIQNLFPSSYGLDTHHSFDGLSKSRSGQVKQLKAYLMLFEQVIADHQSQLSNIGKLFSYESEIAPGESLCQSHYPQGLYHSPGAKYLLKAFDAYKRQNEYLQEHPHKVWQFFVDDPDNSYFRDLVSLSNKVEKDVKSRSQMLSHKLASLGEGYELSGLLQLNSDYGDYHMARVGVLSGLLKGFPLFSENSGRSYFHTDPEAKRKESLKATPLFSGMERRMDLVYQLNSYYKGIVDVVRNGMNHKDPYLHIQVTGKGKDQTILISYYGEQILELPFTHSDSTKTIDYHLLMLEYLCHQTKGFVLLDNQMLLANLPRKIWSIYNGTKRLVFRYQSAGKKTELFDLNETVRLLEANKDRWANQKISVRAAGLADKYEDQPSSDQVGFAGQVLIFLPLWVTRVREKEFSRLFLQNIQNEGPVNLDYRIRSLNAKVMGGLLSARHHWLEGIRHLQNGKPMGPKAEKSQLNLIKLVMRMDKLRRKP
ncbi:hypothetical protein [Marinoscillum sp.]|uniref:hypothetical protein n=1 Tax=Marinoscillum sp. TaxID=2024838 RepID=UPI003BAD004D